MNIFYLTFFKHLCGIFRKRTAIEKNTNPLDEALILDIEDPIGASKLQFPVQENVLLKILNRLR